MLAAPSNQPASTTASRQKQNVFSVPDYPRVPGALGTLECTHCWYSVFKTYRQALVSYPEDWSSTICEAHLKWELRRRKLKKQQSTSLGRREILSSLSILWLIFAVSPVGAYFLGIWPYIMKHCIRWQEHRIQTHTS